MDFKGTFENGVIRPHEAINLPNGTEVECHPVAESQGSNGVSPQQTSLDELRRMARDAGARKSLDEIAATQGNKPVSSIEELRAEWPDNDPADSPDALLKNLREWRR